MLYINYVSTKLENDTPILATAFVVGPFVVGDKVSIFYKDPWNQGKVICRLAGQFEILDSS